MTGFSKIYSILDAPAVHNTVQKVLSLGKGTEIMSSAIRTVMKPKAHERVLDMGCGTGRYASLFDCRYVGVDLNEKFLRFGAQQKGISDSHSFVLANIKDWAFKEGSFDYVLCVGVLHHLPNSLVSILLENFKKVLKKGGKACILEPIYPQNRWNIPGQILFALDRGEFTRTKQKLDPLMREQGYSDGAYQIPAAESFPQEVWIYEYAA